MKDFKTIDQLVQLLESRGVITDEWTPLAIERESYYAVVNGYKEPFLDKKAMASTHEDVYLPGTRFEWIYYLFMFDRELRALTFRYLARAEAIMKNAIVYCFCEKNQGAEDYMDRSRYVSASNMLVTKGWKGNKAKAHAKNLKRLMETFEAKTNRDSEKAFIRHYARHHGYVPLWVVSNDLTFGNVSNFYQLQTKGVQNAACKKIIHSTGKNYGPGVLTPDSLLMAFSVLVKFRNLCAHDERLYCAKVGRDRKQTYTTMLYYLMLILPEGSFEELMDDLANLFDIYGDHLHVVTKQGLLKDMGMKTRQPSVKE